MNKYRGVVFDFNGVLFWDSELQVASWQEIALFLRGKPLTIDEIRNKIHGRYTGDAIRYLTNYKASDQLVKIMSNKKESLYRELCLRNRAKFMLSPGAVEVLDFLVAKNIPRTIATASRKTNLDFFFKHLSLSTWFDKKLVTYDDGSFPGKPAPDIYLLACRKINIVPPKCIVFEDSISGIKAAYNAKIGKIIAIRLDKKEKTVDQYIALRIDSFKDIKIEDLL